MKAKVLKSEYHSLPVNSIVEIRPYNTNNYEALATFSDGTKHWLFMRKEWLELIKSRIYISHAIRGSKGKKATLEDMQKNCERVLEFVEKCKQAFPGIEFYVPAEHEDFVQKAYNKKYLTEKQILEIDCNIISECDAVLFYDAEQQFSNGMKIELKHAQKIELPYGIVTEWNEHTKKIINLLIGTEDETTQN